MFGKTIYFLLFTCITLSLYGQPGNTPLNHDYQRDIDKRYIEDVFNDVSNNKNASNINANSHRSMRPMMQERILNYEANFDTIPRKRIIGDKIFNESLFIIDQPNFYLTIDPLMRFEGGQDLASDTTYGRLFWNTRGILIKGNIGKKIAFGSEFYENQARLPLYQMNYVNSRGQLFLNNNGTYRVDNAVIPGMGRTKPFRETGFDFAYSAGYISFSPIDQLNIQFGHGQHFVGNGYRSLFLSDNSFNYPYLRFTSSLWKNRLQYTNIYGGLLNLYRLPEFSAAEANFEKKSGTFHYLNFNIHPKIQIGIFEGIVWERYDSTQIQPFDGRILNPVLLSNSISLGQNNLVHNNILGFNISIIPIKNTEVYAQIMNNGLYKENWGVQLGAKYFDLFRVKNLFLQLEFNQVSPYTYGAVNERRTYSHFNLPLAHPAGTGFREITWILSYDFKKVFTRIQYSLFQKSLDDLENFNNGSALFTSNLLPANPNAEKGIINYFQGELGYRFNKTTRLELYTGVIYREEAFSTFNQKTTYVMLGLRTRMRNQYFDF